MKVQSISQPTFTAKNTYLQKSKIANAAVKEILGTKNPAIEKQAAKLEFKSTLYKSMHLEAKARLYNIKSEKEISKLEKYGTLEGFWNRDMLDILSEGCNVAKILARGALLKVKSFIAFGDAYAACPERYEIVDKGCNEKDFELYCDELC